MDTEYTLELDLSTFFTVYLSLFSLKSWKNFCFSLNFKLLFAFDTDILDFKSDKDTNKFSFLLILKLIYVELSLNLIRQFV